MLNRPGKGAFTADGLTMYFVDSGNNCLRKVGAIGIVETVAGSAQSIGDGFLSGFIPGQPQPSFVDFTTGNVVIIDNDRLWIYAASSSGAVTTFRGSQCSAAAQRHRRRRVIRLCFVHRGG